LEPIAEFAFAEVLDRNGERLALRPAHETSEPVRQALGKAIASVKLRPVSRDEERALARLRQAAMGVPRQKLIRRNLSRRSVACASDASGASNAGRQDFLVFREPSATATSGGKPLEKRG
jgi:hypothetical protein